MDTALWRARSSNPGLHFNNSSFYNSEPTLMEIGNINGGPLTTAKREERKKDIERGAFFK